MIKDSIQQNESTTPNSKQLAVLKEHFPACFKADGSFDVERFKAEIAATANVVNEGYELKFLGKSYAKLLASAETTTVIQPNEEHNNLPENANSENIYISGDNLDGLKHLLKSYNGAIKCIYIDPPYNTGSDGFVYADNFNYTKENLQEKLSVSEEEADRILDLTKRGSASHSAWLMFMYSRLLLARDLLKDDGVIFISIDDNEQANLKLLCDDVFGEESFVACLPTIMNLKGNHDNYGFSDTHEYTLVYVNDKSAFEFGHFEIDDESLNDWEEDEYGLFKRADTLRRTGQDASREKRPKGFFPIFITSEDNIYVTDDDVPRNSEDYVLYPINEDGVELSWTWGKKKITDENYNLFVVDGRNGKNIYKKQRPQLGDLPTKKPKTIWYKPEYSTSTATTELKKLMGEKIFDGPKPVPFLSDLITISCNKEDLILDFFSGSGSTAHAVMELNANDAGNRKFISVQLPELLKEDNPSQKVAFEFLKENNLPTTLDYIGFKRIKRAAAKIKEEHPDKELDLGFKHYILQEPNQNTLDKLDSFDKAALLADTTIMEEFGKPTILTTWLNADGYGLTVQAEAIDLAGYTAYYCQKHLYLIDPGFTLESMKALLSKYDAEGHFNPENMVLFGYSFPDWSINEMIEKNLRILNDGEKNLKINFTVRY